MIKFLSELEQLDGACENSLQLGFSFAPLRSSKSPADFIVDRVEPREVVGDTGVGALCMVKPAGNRLARVVDSLLAVLVGENFEFRLLV